LQAQYLQAQKMEAVGRLAGGIAHDFNNLLTVINGYGLVLLRQLEQQEHAKDLINQILQAGDRAATLTQQLLAYSRKQHQFLRVLNLNALLRDAERMLRRMIGEDIELIASLENDVAPIKADPSQIDQVMMNLAVNARDAMPHGGTLTIRTQNVQKDEFTPGDQFDLPFGSYVLLTVADTGLGMDAVTLERVFEPFFTTKEMGKGTGLGLATVYGIIRQSGGHILVSSEPGAGTCFDIYFPVVRGEPSEEEKSMAVAGLPTGHEVVLLAEDELSVRVLIRYLLHSQGYTVLEASSGPEALVLAERHSGPIDLLITDVVMPRMSGPQLAQELRKSRPHLRVLYLSGYADDSVFRYGLSDTEATFLQKPFANTSLALKVRQVLDENEPPFPERER
jgi:CheY-like chemotaxis protein